MTVYNMPIYSLHDFDIGGARIWIGTEGTTPSIELGANADVSIEPSFTEAQVRQGTPRLLIDSSITDEDLGFSITLFETSLENVERAIGYAGQIGTRTSPGKPNIFAFGGNPDKTRYSVKIEHVEPTTGCTIEWKFWKTEVRDAPTIEYGQDNYHAVSMSMQCVASTQTWSGVDSLSGGQVGMYAWFERYDSATYSPVLPG